MRTTLTAGLTAALASSLCCIAPALAVVAGTSSVAAYFDWLGPFQPYLMGITVSLLGIAWYRQLKSRPAGSCGCELPKQPFMHSKSFLSIASVVALLLLTYPGFSGFINQDSVAQQPIASAQKTAYVAIKGMTCTGCEQHVKQEISKVKGISEVTVSYEKGNATVKYDEKKTSLAEIKKAVNATGYKAIDAKTL